MNTHTLKTDHAAFQAVAAGLKTFEIRKDDRGFQVGDRLDLLETVSTGAEMAAGAPLEYTGGQVWVFVTHILRGPIYGLADGWVVLSVKDDLTGSFDPDCRPDGRCQYAIDHGAEGMGHCPRGKCVMPNV